YIKRYPVEYHAQTAVEAALAIREELLKGEGVDAVAGITDVEVGSYDVAIEIIGRDPEKWRPHTRETADHSFPYCVAVALSDGKVALRSFEAKRLVDPLLKALIQKVRVVPQPEFVGRYQQVDAVIEVEPKDIACTFLPLPRLGVSASSWRNRPSSCLEPSMP